MAFGTTPINSLEQNTWNLSSAPFMRIRKVPRLSFAEIGVIFSDGFLMDSHALARWAVAYGVWSGPRIETVSSRAGYINAPFVSSLASMV